MKELLDRLEALEQRRNIRGSLRLKSLDGGAQ